MAEALSHNVLKQLGDQKSETRRRAAVEGIGDALDSIVKRKPDVASRVRDIKLLATVINDRLIRSVTHIAQRRGGLQALVQLSMKCSSDRTILHAIGRDVVLPMISLLSDADANVRKEAT
eukprot:gene10452-444_t